MESKIIEKKYDLEREVRVSRILIACLKMKVGESKSFKIPDNKVYQRVRTGIHRLSIQLEGLNFKYRSLKDALNTIEITRIK